MSISATQVTPGKVARSAAVEAVGASTSGTVVNVSVQLVGAQIRASGATPPVSLADASFTVKAKLDKPLGVHLAEANAKGTIDSSPVMQAIVARIATSNDRPKLIALAVVFLADADNASAGSFGVNPSAGSPVRLFLRSDSDANVYYPAKIVDKKVVSDTSAPISIV